MNWKLLRNLTLTPVLLPVLIGLSFLANAQDAPTTDRRNEAMDLLIERARSIAEERLQSSSTKDERVFACAALAKRALDNPARARRWSSLDDLTRFEGMNESREIALNTSSKLIVVPISKCRTFGPEVTFEGKPAFILIVAGRESVVLATGWLNSTVETRPVAWRSWMIRMEAAS